MPHYAQPTRPQAGYLKIVELFETLQGEGKFIGTPSVFVRTGMCNLECSGCDTKWTEWDETPIETVAIKIQQFQAKHVVFTGGEPTLWQEALLELANLLPADHTITVETNGAVPIFDNELIHRIDLWSFSPKVGSLGFDEKFSHETVLKNIYDTEGKNQIKYVLDPFIPEHVDSVFAFQDKVDDLFMRSTGYKPSKRLVVPDEAIFFQPLDRETRVNISNAVKGVEPVGYSKDLVALSKLVMERSGSRFRVLPQYHKLLSWR